MGCFIKASEIEPNNYLAWYCQGVAYSQFCRYEEAIHPYEMAFRITPIMQGEAGSRSDYYECISIMQQRYYREGKKAFELNKFKEALENSDRILKFECFSDEAMYLKGRSLYYLQEFYESALFFEKVFYRHPNLERMTAEDSEKKIKTAQNLDYTNTSVWLSQAACNAINLLKKSVQLDKQEGFQNDSKILGLLGISYRCLGDNRKAIKYLVEASEMSEKSGDKRNQSICEGNLGLTYSYPDTQIQYKRDKKDAIKHLAKAVIIAKEIGDKRNESLWLCEVGSLLEKRNKEKLVDALVCFMLANEIRAELGESLHETITKINYCLESLAYILKKAIHLHNEGLLEAEKIRLEMLPKLNIEIDNILRKYSS